MKKAIYKGFTLIELLVVISIIGMIVAFAMFGMQGAFEASRDANRKSDLEQYEVALEIFANNNDGFYPKYPGVTPLDTVCNSNFGVSNCPLDPEEVSYQYISDADGLKYAISADLEGDDDYDWMVCSGGIVGEAGAPSTDGSCTVGSAPVGATPPPGGQGECFDSDVGPNAQYIGGYVDDATGVVTYDTCSAGLGSVFEQYCGGNGAAVGTPIGCDVGTLCVDDGTGGAYCSSGGGGCEEAACNTTCAFGGSCNPIIDECVCNDDPSLCFDSDGYDFDVVGYCTDPTGTYNDHCGWGGVDNTYIEYVCTGDYCTETYFGCGSPGCCSM